MKRFWILVAVAVAGGLILIASGVRTEWWSSLFIFAFTFTFLRIYFLRVQRDYPLRLRKVN